MWKSCGAAVLPFDDDCPVYAGLDLSARTDLTALVIVGQINGVWHAVPHFWTPTQGLLDRARRDRAPYDMWQHQGHLRTTPGATVDYEHVAHDMATILDGLNVQAIAYDRWRIDLLRKEFDKIGVESSPVGMGARLQGYGPGTGRAGSGID